MCALCVWIHMYIIERAFRKFANLLLRQIRLHFKIWFTLLLMVEYPPNPRNIILDQGISIRSQPFPHSLPPGCHAIGILQYAKHPMFTVHVSEYNEILLQRDAMHIKMSILEIQ